MKPIAKSLCRFLLCSLFTFSVCAANGPPLELVELARLMDGSENSSTIYSDFESHQLKMVQFSSPAFISELSISERVIDSSQFIIERTTSDFAGNSKSEKIKLSENEFYARIQMVADYLKANGQSPIQPLEMWPMLDKKNQKD